MTEGTETEARFLTQDEAKQVIDEIDQYQEDHKEEIQAAKEKRRQKYDEAALGGTFTLVDPIGFIGGVRNNTDGYGFACFDYATRWATLMEARIDEGDLPEEIIPEIAKETSSIADVEGITGYMYGMAVSMLAACWVHGEILKKWHNNEYGQPDAEGTVNPAIITVGTPK